MEYIISENKRYNSLEIKFTAKPDEETRNALKALKFRWNAKRGLWYGFAAPETVRTALSGDPVTEPAPEPAEMAMDSRKPAKPDQSHIRIYWNGLKIDGGNLVGCYYHYDASAETVCISAKNYDDLPRDLFDVTNETDIYTDYFDNDRATVDASHPLYPYLRYAALKEDARYAARNVERIEKRLSGGDRLAEKLYAGELARDRARLEAFRAERDPGQPTAADLAEIDRQRTEAENARREAEHKAELEAREKLLRQRSEGREYIESVNEKFPIRAGEPVVEIPFSENPAFYSWTESRDKTRTEVILHADGTRETKTVVEEPRRRLILSVKAADVVLDHFDKLTALEHRGYDKTDFIITWTELGETEESRYEGRYDLGDRDGGMIAHIRAVGRWYLNHDEFGREKPEPETENDRTRLADWLENFCGPDKETA